MGSNKVSVDNHLKISATPSLATIIFTESARIGKPETRTGSCLNSKWLRTIESTVLTCVILFVCGLFTIPTILYAVPGLQHTHSLKGAFNNNSCQDGLNDKNASGLGCINTSMPGDHSELRCAERFFLDNSSGSPTCIPLCKNWLTVEAEDVVLSIGLVVAIISSVILFVIAWLQRDTMFAYPTSYLIYVGAILISGGPFFVIGSLLKAEVFCSSDSYIESVINSSPFCVINGVVGVYALLHTTLLLTFHAVGLSWGIMFPFHYRRFKAYGRIKYIHASTLALSLVLPAIPALLHLIHGYTITINLHNTCLGRNESIGYYFVTLPMSILAAVTTSVFAILVWKIFKELILKKFLLKQKPRANVGKAEVKIFVVMCYYILLGVILISNLAYLHATADSVSEEVQAYFYCHSAGIQPDRDCGDVPEVHLQTLGILGLFLQRMLPIVIVIFIVDWKCNHKCLKRERTDLRG